MSTTSETPISSEKPPVRAEPRDAGRRKPRTPRRGGIVVVMIVSLIAASAMQWWSRVWQRSAVPGMIVNSRAGLGTMNTFALSLVLGGLRGPLVMFLWTTSEAQKNNHDLEDFDTKIEWIRLLQPEFDTVHMFQIWNKAYNISVMMASPVDKYTTILSAIQYAQDVLAERPDDMNIFQSLGQVYGNKMSGESTQERPFYERQFRLESMTDNAREKAYGPDPDFRRLGNPKYFQFLDDNGNIREQFLTPTRPRPAELADNLPWNDGSQLEYLKKYQPFPYGILPIAMAFNADMASDACMLSENQLPLQLSPLVTDSRPGLDLKMWAEEEAKMGVGLVGQSFGVDADSQPALINNIPFTAKLDDPHALQEAEYRFNLSSRLCGDAIVQYKRHLANPAYYIQAQNYASHLMDLAALESMSKADALFCQYFLTPNPAERRSILAQAGQAYRAAATEYEREVLLYYTEATIAKVAFPPGYSHENISTLPANQVAAVYGAVERAAGSNRFSPHDEDRQLYAVPILRAIQRDIAIQQALQ